MNPDIEDFLNSAFESIQPTSSEIGRVVVEPDYDNDPSPSDAAAIRAELVEILRAPSLDASDLSSPEGFELVISDGSTLVSKYIRRITLHADKLDGSWVEVAPPGNWI